MRWASNVARVVGDEKLWYVVNRKRQSAETCRHRSQTVRCHRHGEALGHLSEYQLVKGLGHGVCCRVSDHVRHCSCQCHDEAVEIS